jgi:tetratricopeptide (TPR) repeat protein
MMKIDSHRAAWLLLAALAAAAPALAAREGRLVGRVLDPDGKPIPGVSVNATAKSLAHYEKTATTDGKGIFIIDIEKIGVVYTYRFEKAGYQPILINETWNTMGTVRREFRMAPGAAASTGGELVAPTSAGGNPAIAAFNEGVRAFEVRDYKAAVARFEQALRLDPSLRQAWAALGQIHLEQKRYPEAAEAAEKAIALGAGGPSILRVRWEAYRHLDDEAKTRAAREDLEKATRLEDDARRIHNEAVALAKIGNHQDAFARFKEAAEIDPSLDPAWLGMAQSGLEIDRGADALAAARKLLESNPAHPEALRLRYNAALKLKDEAEVVDALVALAAIEPAVSRDNLYKLARQAFDADDAVRAKERFAKVLALDAEHPRANYYMGVLLVRENDKAGARAHLQKFLRLAPNDPEAGTAKGLLGFIGS